MRDWLWVRMVFAAVDSCRSHAFENVELTVQSDHMSVRGTAVCRRQFAAGKTKRRAILLISTSTLSDDATPDDACLDCLAELRRAVSPSR